MRACGCCGEPGTHSVKLTIQVINGEVKVPTQVEGGDQGEEKYFERARAVAMASLGIT